MEYRRQTEKLQYVGECIIPNSLKKKNTRDKKTYEAIIFAHTGQLNNTCSC